MAKKSTQSRAKAKDTAASGTSLEKLNETGRRQKSDRRKKNAAVASERRKTPRRRQIDPTTCERDYTDAEIEFMHALDDYKRRSGLMFPTCSEILEVLQDLGYQKVDVQSGQCCQQQDCESDAASQTSGAGIPG
jgi:hypothetical protein